MKLTYKYVWKWYTVVRLDEKSMVSTKVREWQTVESDRAPKYFLEAWFVAVDLDTKEDVAYATERLEAEKKLESLKDKKVSKNAKVAMDVSTMSIEELREELTNRGIKFNANCSKPTLERKLSEAMLAGL